MGIFLGCRDLMHHRRHFLDLPMKQLQDFFRVERTPYFLFMKMVDGTPTSIHAGEGVPSNWATVFETNFGWDTRDLELRGKLPFAAGLMLTRVAQSSRRAMGNVLFGNEKTLSRITDSLSILDNHTAKLAKLVIVPEFEEDLVWATYSKFTIRDPQPPIEKVNFLSEEMSQSIRDESVRVESKYPNGLILVDGPFAVYEDVLYTNPNWQDYFYKAYV